MAKYIYAEEVPESSSEYLTVGKRYEILHHIGIEFKSYIITDDNGERIFCAKSNSAHLDGGSWIETDTP